MEIIKNYIPVFVSSIFCILVYCFSKKDLESRFITLEKFSVMLVASILLSFLSVCAFDYMAKTLYPLIMRDQPLSLQLRHLGTVNNLEIIIKNLFLVLPLLLLVKEAPNRKYLGLRNIDVSKWYCLLLSLAAVIFMGVLDYLFCRLHEINNLKSFEIILQDVFPYQLTKCPLFFGNMSCNSSLQRVISQRVCLLCAKSSSESDFCDTRRIRLSSQLYWVESRHIYITLRAGRCLDISI